MIYMKGKKNKERKVKKIMKKKGFTLVELLAVIAILAILIVLALPNVMGMYNQSQKSAFVTELKSIISAAETQFVNDSTNMGGDAKGIAYTRVKGVALNANTSTSFPRSQITAPAYKELDLKGTASIDFYLEYNLAGKIIAFYATDRKFQFAFEGDDLKGADIGSVDLKEGATCEGDTATNPPKTALKLSLENSGKINRDLKYNTGVVTVADATEYCPNQAFTKIELVKVDGNTQADPPTTTQVYVKGTQTGHTN